MKPPLQQWPNTQRFEGKHFPLQIILSLSSLLSLHQRFNTDLWQYSCSGKSLFGCSSRLARLGAELTPPVCGHSQWAGRSSSHPIFSCSTICFLTQRLKATGQQSVPWCILCVSFQLLILELFQKWIHLQIFSPIIFDLRWAIFLIYINGVLNT